MLYDCTLMEKKNKKKKEKKNVAMSSKTLLFVCLFILSLFISSKNFNYV